jgi:hypothetical protein
MPLTVIVETTARSSIRAVASGGEITPELLRKVHAAAGNRKNPPERMKVSFRGRKEEK